MKVMTNTKEEIWYYNKTPDMIVALNKGDKDYAHRLLEEDRRKADRLRSFSKNQQVHPGLSQILDKDDMHKVVYNDGTTYIGELKGQKKHGKGRLVDHKGDVYEGEFYNDNIEGFGMFKGSDGTEYEGNWKFGQQHGFGKELWPDDSYYEGQYKAGLKHGKGKYYWADGSWYDGEWINGNIHGYVGSIGVV